ncbi:metallopeptidase family protein [Nocardioides sp. BP30]|uniref:metallopeptidase family protein n=1 Tax=Nocardioides sp. BP30 TaxID=3036374 RepID=UPI0024688063|nr:metallopeptidase family protein [Nocardioides sp. BP30]WGL52156.1 metallopeptidase family protein [Nocardioides sp. BP30]
MVDVSPERFEELVDDALDAIPDELAALVHNLVVLVEEEPPPGEAQDLLGLYDGSTLGLDAAGYLPDRIFLYRRPLLDYCRTEAELVREVRVTVVHELGHHFGLDDARLHELGWA